MGDRALIQMKDSAGNVSPVCYLHNNRHTAAKFILETARLMEGRGDDLSYAFARLVGVCHDSIPGNMSLGVWSSKLLTKADSQGDAGIFIVNVKTWEVECAGGYGKSFNATPTELKRYLVDVVKTQDGFEETAKTLVYATSPKDAKHRAIVSHARGELEWTGDQASDCDGEILLYVQGQPIELSDEDAEVLERLNIG